MPNINKVNGDKERAVKHYIIAATQGEDDSTEMLMRGFMVGLVAKNVLDVTLHLCSSFVIRRHTTARYSGMTLMTIFPVIFSVNAILTLIRSSDGGQ